MISQRIVPGLVLLLLGLLSWLPAAEAQQQAELPVVQSRFRVEAGRASYFQFKLPAYYRDGKVAGNALAAGGSGNDIRVLVMTERQFQVWTRSLQPEALYNSGQRRSVVLSVPVNDPGTYYVVFDNRFSALSAKNVQADIRFVHQGVDTARADEVKRQATERDRRIGGILGKLVVTLRAGEKQLGTHQIQTPIYIGVLDDPSLNAAAMWQKRAIVVTRGTMELVEAMPGNEGDEVLAGVLAHELSHIFYRHTFGNEQQAAGEAAVSAGAAAVMINPLVGLAVAGLAWDRSKRYDRMQETEADVLGVKLACAAGFDPSGLLTFMERLKEQNPSHVSFLQTHPSPAQRVQYLQGTIEKLNCPRRATVAAAGTADADDSSKQARAKKAQGDLRILTSAISIYAAHTGQLPSSLTALTNPVRNRQGAVAGPFLAVVPSPPPGWSQYAYAPQPNGVFTVTTTGDDTTLSLP